MKLLSLFTAALALGGAQAFPAADKQSREIALDSRGLQHHAARDGGLHVRMGVTPKPKPKTDPKLPYTKPKAPKDKDLSESEDDYREVMKGEPKRPSKWQYELPSDKPVKLGESGIHVQTDKKGQKYVMLYYGDIMKFHASHQKYFHTVYKFLGGRGFKVRAPDNKQTREETLRGLLSYVPSARDENPPLRWGYLHGSHTVMRVPDGESSMQGTMIQQALRLGGHDAIFMAVDNRGPTTSDVKGKLLRGPEDLVDGWDKPKTTFPAVDEAKMKQYTFLVPKELLPTHLQKRGPNTDKPEDLVDIITLAPMYNSQMTGDDRYNPSLFSKRSAAPNSFLSARDIISSIEDQQSSANDTSVSDEQDQVQMWIWARSIAQANATMLLQPYVDAIMNGSNNPMAEAMVWSLYSMINPSVNVLSPFMGPADMFDDMATDYAGNFTLPEDDAAGYKDYASNLGNFNAFVYNRAVEAVNKTGLLADLYKLDDWLSATDPSSFPDGSWEVDDHASDPMFTYLSQMADYNGFAWDGTNATGTTGESTPPQWVMDRLNVTAIIELGNATTATNVTHAASATGHSKPRAVAFVS